MACELQHDHHAGVVSNAIYDYYWHATHDVLVSGWLEGEAVIAGRPAAADVHVGTGRVVLLGFPVQHRAQSHATFRLLFDSIFTAR